MVTTHVSVAFSVKIECNCEVGCNVTFLATQRTKTSLLKDENSIFETI